MTYHPPVSREDVDSVVFDLHELSRHSQEILVGTAREVLPQLLRAGGSPGGARPKVLVGYNDDTGTLISGEDDLPEGFDHWMVKFPAASETGDAGAIEYAYSLMAREAGIDVSPTRLFECPQGNRFFGIRRFDRGSKGALPLPNRRRHMHTFGNLLQSNFRIPSADYGDLLKATSLLTRNHQDVLHAFRRMTFNVLTHNRDDHVKNVAFLLDDSTGDWTLSPAYDLLFSTGPGGEHTMTIAGEGRHPDRSHMAMLARQAGISAAESEAILEQARYAVGRWPEHAAAAGLSRAAASQLARRLPAVD